ncbi:carbohydrate ABC transporter permease [Rhizobium sp. X9]|uniref:carbohydrate ABC transporter permease n=1 Tax=Rhizobium sp. X9 TaxID=2815360 RepID=UPI001C0E1AF4|nr:carbohydrate ABC transporter permease [Rhizobium sp. X9]
MKIGKIFGYLVLAAMAGLVIYPIAFMISLSFQNATQIFSEPGRIIPAEPTIGNYVKLISEGNILKWLTNSAIVAVSTTILKLFIDSLAGFAFARLKFRYKDLLFGLVIATMMVPVAVTMIPRFLLLKEAGLLNSLWALILPYLAYPLGIFLLRQAISEIPEELDEATIMDGGTMFDVYWRVILPLVKPALAVVAITTFMAQWVDLLWPVVSINATELRTVTVGVATMKSEQTTNQWGLIMAANTLAVLPIIVVFLFAQRFFMSGLTAGSVK